MKGDWSFGGTSYYKTEEEYQSEIIYLLRKEAIVYTTASNPELRLTQTEKVTVKSAQQPVENKILVFVNPKK